MIFKKWRKERAKKKRQERLARFVAQKSPWANPAPLGFNPRQDGGKELDWNEGDKQIIPTYYEYDEEGNCLGYKEQNNVSSS